MDQKWIYSHTQTTENQKPWLETLPTMIATFVRRIAHRRCFFHLTAEIASEILWLVSKTAWFSTHNYSRINLTCQSPPVPIPVACSGARQSRPQPPCPCSRRHEPASPIPMRHNSQVRRPTRLWWPALATSSMTSELAVHGRPGYLHLLRIPQRPGHRGGASSRFSNESIMRGTLLESPPISSAGSILIWPR